MIQQMTSLTLKMLENCSRKTRSRSRIMPKRFNTAGGPYQSLTTWTISHVNRLATQGVQSRRGQNRHNFTEEQGNELPKSIRSSGFYKFTRISRGFCASRRTSEQRNRGWSWNSETQLGTDRHVVQRQAMDGRFSIRRLYL